MIVVAATFPGIRLCCKRRRERITSYRTITEVPMASPTISQTLNRGGSFLISTSAAEDVFSPADLTDDQRLIGQTAEEFVQKEVVPNIPELEAHKDEKLMGQMLKK